MEENKVVDVAVEEMVNEAPKVAEEAAKNINWKKVGVGAGIASGVLAALGTGGYFLLKHFANKD